MTFVALKKLALALLLSLSLISEIHASSYSLIQGSYTWQQARDEAASLGGHLATVTSSNEWNTIVNYMGR